jgi:hypothetical protein
MCHFVVIIYLSTYYKTLIFLFDIVKFAKVLHNVAQRYFEKKCKSIKKQTGFLRIAKPIYTTPHHYALVPAQMS